MGSVALLVASKGGHLEQAKRFSSALPAELKRVFVVDQPEGKLENVVVLKRVVDYEKKSGLITKTLRSLHVGFNASRLIKSTQPSIIVTFGGAFCVPVALSAKWAGVEVFHVESWSRISTVSRTTKLMRILKLCKVVGYQYKESPLSRYEDCRYIGHL